jgi:hypothetical protein
VSDKPKITLWFVHTCYWEKGNHASIWVVPHGRDYTDFSIPQEHVNSEKSLELQPGETSTDSVFTGENCVKALGPVPVGVALEALKHLKATFKYLGCSVDQDETADD